MKFSSTRELDGLREVLKDPNSSGQDPVYWGFNGIGGERWENITIIAPGSYNGEFPKTYGHYHCGANVPETYHLIGGEGVLMLQKKFMVGENWIQNQVDSVYLVKVKVGEEVVITSEFGHAWSNTGKTAFISYDDWRSGHTPADYQQIKDLQGLAYYLISDGDDIKVVPNPKYKNLPEPIWVTAESFNKLQQQ